MLPLTNRILLILVMAWAQFANASFDSICPKFNEIPSVVYGAGYAYTDGQGHNLSNFLDRVADIAEKVALNNDLLAQDLRLCLRNSAATKSCPQALDYAARIPEIVRKARFHWALSPGELIRINNRKILFRSNASLTSKLLYKEKAWEPLTEIERSEVEGSIADYIRQLHEIYQNDISPNFVPAEIRRQMSQDLDEVRRSHLALANSYLVAYPILQYLTSHNPSPEDISAAALKISLAAEDWILHIREIRSHIGKTEYLEHDAIQLLRQTALVESALGAEPGYCDLIKYNAEVWNVQQTYLTYGIFIGLLPFGWLPVAISTGFSAALAWNAYFDFEASRQVFLSQFLANGLVESPESLTSAKANKDMILYLAPLPLLFPVMKVPLKNLFYKLST